MNNPLDSAMDAAKAAIIIENLRDMLSSQVELMKIKAELNAEYYRQLIAEGVPEVVANTILIFHDPFRAGGAPNESGGPDD